MFSSKMLSLSTTLQPNETHMQLYHEKTMGGIWLQNQELKALSCPCNSRLPSAAFFFPLGASKNFSRIWELQLKTPGLSAF